MNAEARKNITRFAATAAVMAITSIAFLAPAASAAPMKLCDMEMGPKGLQCVQETEQAELCKLDKDLKCVQPPKQSELCKLDKDLKCVPKHPGLCELEMGPDGLQCAGEEADDAKTPDEPKPPVDPGPESEPEPQPEPGAGEDPQPQVKPEPVGANVPVEAEVAQTDASDFEIAASPATEEPPAPSHAAWIGSALVASGLLFVAARRRTQARQDAVSALEDM